MVCYAFDQLERLDAAVSRLFLLLLKVAISALILAAFIWKLDFGAVLHALSSISPYAVTAALFVIVAQVFASASRLIFVIALFRHRFELLDSLRVTMESMFFSQTFLSFLGGDALRIWRVYKAGLSARHATNAVLQDRLTGIIVNHLCLLASLPWLLSVMEAGPVRAALIILAAAGLGGVGLLIFLAVMPPGIGIARYLPLRIRHHKIVELLIEASTVGRHLILHWRGMAPVVLLSLLTVFGNCLVFFLILCGMGVAPANALYCALLVPAVLEIAMLPISIAGWGVREATTMVAFGVFGVAPDTALAASLTFGFILVGVSLLGGIVWMFDDRRLRAHP